MEIEIFIFLDATQHEPEWGRGDRSGWRGRTMVTKLCHTVETLSPSTL